MKALNHSTIGGTKYLPLTLLIIILIFTLYSWHQLINSDSVSGFDAMKGPFWTGKFNTLLYYDPGTHRLEERFLTWWSPGQYLAPLIFMKLLPIKIGTAVTLVNFFGTCIGAIGYFLVFKYYHFESRTIWVSVILMLFSSSILQRYYLYDGGESLNFMVFPWILVFQQLLVNKYLKYIFPGFILFISFVCKLQMLIVVPLLLFMLVAANSEDLNFFFIWNKPFRLQELKQTVKTYIPYFISVTLVCFLIYFGFISKGATPANAVHHISLRPVNFLFPVASPVTSIYFFDSLNAYLASRTYLQIVYLFILCVGELATFFYLIKHYHENDTLKRKYGVIVLMLFLISSMVFSALYAGGSSVDFNPRHFKLVSFLIYPLIVELAFRRLNQAFIFCALGFLVLFAVGNHVRLSKKWNADTSITSSGFRLSKEDLPLNIKENLDARIKVKTVVASSYSSRYAIDNQLLLPVLATAGDSSDLIKSGYPVIHLDSVKR